MARIAIDCDGVLANFVGAFVRVFNQVHAPKRITEEGWTSWGGGGQFSAAEENVVWKVIKDTHNFWLTLDAYHEAVNSLSRWLAGTAGHDVWIVTSRMVTAGGTPAMQTKLWMEQCGIKPWHNYLGVITVPNSDDKLDICSRLDIRWMIDDKVETIEAFDRFPYMRAALMDGPWNKQARPKWRVTRMEEFLGRIK